MSAVLTFKLLGSLYSAMTCLVYSVTAFIKLFSHLSAFFLFVLPVAQWVMNRFVWKCDGRTALFGRFCKLDLCLLLRGDVLFSAVTILLFCCPVGGWTLLHSCVFWINSNQPKNACQCFCYSEKRMWLLKSEHSHKFLLGSWVTCYKFYINFILINTPSTFSPWTGRSEVRMSQRNAPWKLNRRSVSLYRTPQRRGRFRNSLTQRPDPATQNNKEILSLCNPGLLSLSLSSDLIK